jgi:hypothetical protein
MFQKVADHFRYFRGVYLALVATLLMMVGLASFEPNKPFYGGDSSWLMASVLGAQKPNPYTNGEFVIDVVKRLKKASCFEELCADMKGGMPDEQARCELEKRGVFDKPTNYKWYDQEFNRAEAIKTIVGAFDVPMNEGATQPFKDVKAKMWYAPYVAAAVDGKLIKDNWNHQFKPDDLAASSWAKTTLRKVNLKQMCAQ